MSVVCAMLAISGASLAQPSLPAAEASTRDANRGASDARPESGAANEAYTQDELDALLTPVALYPDALLSQLLMASTYPLEVVEADRFMRQNAGLQGEALDDALAKKRWDPSVQSLAGYPKVLAMMSEKLEWTERLGNAVLEDEGRVMDTVQSLRRRARAAGHLESTAEQKVVTERDTIVIEPTQKDVVYVYDYDPAWVYGAYWSAAAASYYGRYYGGYSYSVSVSYSTYRISSNHWNGSRADWSNRRLSVEGHDNRFWSQSAHAAGANGAWQHDGLHRRGVDYPNAATRERFGGAGPDRVAGPRGPSGDPWTSGPGTPRDRPGSGLGPPHAGAGAGVGALRGEPGGAGLASLRPPPFAGGPSGMPNMPSMPPMPGPPPLPGPH
ncbi:MAG TPA: DUF3300 domain-containing protein [Caldimonas sp.]|nr:DUF3300 domain-containing protein [Caldimonas sp.]